MGDRRRGRHGRHGRRRRRRRQRHHRPRRSGWRSRARPGAAGAHGASGQPGVADTFLVNADGGVSAIDGAASTIVYLAIDNAVQIRGRRRGADGLSCLRQPGRRPLAHRLGRGELRLCVSQSGIRLFGQHQSVRLRRRRISIRAGILTFAANEQQKVITITVAGDTQLEGDEQFSVSLGSWVGMQPGATIQVTGTILNDDTGLPPSTGDAPVITDYQGDVAIFTENAAPVFIDVSRNSQVRDTDSPYLNGGRLTITISQNYVVGEDVLSFVTEPNGVSLQDGYLYFGAAQIGRVDQFRRDIDRQLHGRRHARPGLAVLRSVTYNNTSDTPNTATRTISVMVSDAGRQCQRDPHRHRQRPRGRRPGPIIDLDADDFSGATGTGYKTTYAPGAPGSRCSTATSPSRIRTARPSILMRYLDRKPQVRRPAFDRRHASGRHRGARLRIFRRRPRSGSEATATYAQYVQALQHIRFRTPRQSRPCHARHPHLARRRNSHASIVVGVPPSMPNDNNGAADSVIEGAAAGTAVGITALASDSDGNPITLFARQ